MEKFKFELGDTVVHATSIGLLGVISARGILEWNETAKEEIYYVSYPGSEGRGSIIKGPILGPELKKHESIS